MNNCASNHQTDFDVDTWYQSPIGKKVAALEKQQLQQLPKSLFGQSILYFGTSIHCNGFGYNHPYSIIIKSTASNTLYHAQCDYTALPFPDYSFDTILLPHILESSANPKTILMESWHALAPEGHLIVLGFNPISLNNLWYLLDKTKLALPGHTKFYSINTLFHWFKNEYYEVISTRNFYYWPLLAEPQLCDNWADAEKLATWLLPYCGSLYMLILKKRTVPLTPLRLRWSWRELIDNKNIVEPAAGNVHRE